MTTPFYVGVTIEGATNRWLTSSVGAGASNHGRTWRSGLQYSGLRVSERADIRGGKLDVDTITLSIIATPEANDEFTRSPRLLAYLSSSLSTTSGTTMNVISNALLVDESHVHIGTECVRITDPSTLAVTIVRAQRDTTAQVHNRVNGETASEVLVWNKVQAWEGRRVSLTVQENGSESTIMRGIISQAPYLNADGTLWLIDVDSVVKALDQEVGRPIDVTAHVLGMKYGTTSAFGFMYGTTSVFSLVDFYETETAFLAALNTQLDAVSVTGVDDFWATMVSDPLHGRCVQVWMDIGGADIDRPDLYFGSHTDGSVRINDFRSEFFPTANGIVSRVPATVDMLANTTYVSTLYPQPLIQNSVGFERARQGGTLDSVRCLIHATAHLPDADYPFHNPTTGDATNDTHDASIMLDIDLVLTVGDILTLSGPTLPEDLRITVSALFSTRGVRFDPVVDMLDDYCQRNGLRAVFLDSSTEIRVSKSLGTGDLSDFMAALIAAAPYANSGGVPFITSSDATASATVVAAATRGIACLEDRDYNVTEPISVLDLIAPELLLLGLMMATDTNGKIAFVPFFVPIKTTPVAATFTAADIVTPFGDAGMWPGWMPATDGIVSIVELTGSKSITQHVEFFRVGTSGLSARINKGGDPQAFIYRDIASISAHKNRGLGTLVISPEATSAADLATTDAISIASRIVAFFGQPYEVVTIKVLRSTTSRALRCGSVIALTSPHVPNSGDGTRGVTARRCIIIGRDVGYDPADGASEIMFTLIMHSTAGTSTGGSLNVAGYAGSAIATAATNVSGNTWDITITAVTYAPTGSSDYEFFAVGDFVSVVQINDSTPNTQTGTVVTSASTNIRVAFDGVAPWGGAFADSYVIEFADVATGMTDAQDDYCYTADSGLLLSNGNPARALL